MGFRKWQYRAGAEERIQEIEETFGVSRFLAGILATRGLQDDQINDLLGETELESPFALKDMDKAVERINRAVEAGEKIAVYGDYDCDGITSTAVLCTYLSSIGAEVTHYIPERDDGGYGLNRPALDRLKGEGVQLLITVDNGITAVEEADYATQLGMELIITDHHRVGDTLPQAVAVIDPQREDCPSRYKFLAGVGVAFKLVAAMEDGDYESTFSYFGDLVAIGTVGDVVPLTGENRTIVKRGLKQIEFSENIGLGAIFDKAKIAKTNATSQYIAFGIVPRINAAGRFGMANKVFDLLMCEDEKQCKKMATELNQLNMQRQEIEQEIQQQIREELTANPRKLYNRVLVFAREGWPHGIIGIVSARVTETYGRPSVLLAIEEGGVARGSARSVDGFSIYEALDANRSLCEKMGGHSAAAGLTIKAENIPALEQGLNDYAREHCERMPEPTYQIDFTVNASDLTVQNVNSLAMLEPFGAQSPSPLFLIKNARLDAVVPLSGGKHIKLKLITETGIIQAIYFGVQRSCFYYQPGAVLNLLVALDISFFNGVQTVSVKVKDVRPVTFEQYKFFSAKRTFETIMRGEPVSPRLKASILPSRKEFAAIYTMLKNSKVFEGGPEQLYNVILRSGINFCKLSVILEVLAEKKLIEIAIDSSSIKVLPAPGKVDVFSSELLHRIEAM